MFKNKWMKYIALAVIVIMSLSMLASCKSGMTYDDLSGEAGAITVLAKDDIQTVPYEGETILVPFETDDPQYAPDTGDGDDDNNGGSSTSDDEVSNGGSSTPDDDDENNGGGDTSDGNDENNGGGDSENSENNGNEEPVDVDTEKFAGDESGTPITMMLQNLWTDSYAGAITLDSLEARGIRFRANVDKYDPDVIAVCEVSKDWGTELEKQFSAEYAVYYMFRSTTNSEGTGILYKKDKYEELARGHFWHSETPDQESSSFGDKSAPARICTWVQLKDKATGVEFYFYSTHFGLDGYNGGPTDVTLRAGKQLANVMDALPKGTYAFALGDLNTNYNGSHYIQFVDMIKLVDLRDLCYEMESYGIGEMGDLGNGTMSGLKQENANGAGTWIDHILAKPNENMAVEYYSVLYDQPAVESENVASYFISDHFGVLAKVRIDTDISYKDFYGDI